MFSLGLEHGKVQIYTGEGKGKTTAALGLCLRAMGYGLKPMFLQFVKERHCSEHDMAQRIGLEIVQGQGQTGEDRDAYILDVARKAVREGVYDVVVLDELGEAMRLGHVRREDVVRLCLDRCPHTELVLTGRGLESLEDVCDLMTVMTARKHYYDDGVLARRGIEW